MHCHIPVAYWQDSNWCPSQAGGSMASLTLPFFPVFSSVFSVYQNSALSGPKQCLYSLTNESIIWTEEPPTPPTGKILSGIWHLATVSCGSYMASLLLHLLSSPIFLEYLPCPTLCCNRPKAACLLINDVHIIQRRIPHHFPFSIYIKRKVLTLT